MAEFRRPRAWMLRPRVLHALVDAAAFSPLECNRLGTDPGVSALRFAAPRARKSAGGWRRMRAAA
jgi:hypothetical protein